MSKKCKVNWSDIDGASPKPKRLHLEKDQTDSLYHCPTQECDHDGFQSQRGCRKHVNTKHSWFFYFDEKPSVNANIVVLEIQSGQLGINKMYHCHGGFQNFVFPLHFKCSSV